MYVYKCERCVMAVSERFATDVCHINAKTIGGTLYMYIYI